MMYLSLASWTTSQLTFAWLLSGTALMLAGAPGFTQGGGGCPYCIGVAETSSDSSPSPTAFSAVTM